MDIGDTLRKAEDDRWTIVDFSFAFARSRSRNIRPATVVAKQIEIRLFHYVIHTTACPEIVIWKKKKKIKGKKMTRYSRASRQTTTANYSQKEKKKKEKTRCTRRASAY